MQNQLLSIKEKVLTDLEQIKDKNELEALRVKSLGKKGSLTSILKQMGSLSAEERPKIGQLANRIRNELEQAISEKQVEIAKFEQEKKIKYRLY